MIPDHKVCIGCGIDKPASDFYKTHGGKYLRSYCKTCDNANSKAYLATPKGKEIKRRCDHAYHAANKDEQNAKSKNRYYADHECTKQKRRELYYQNHDRNIAWKRAHYRQNRDAICAERRTPEYRAKERARRKANADKRRERDRELYWQNRDARLDSMYRYRHTPKGRRTMDNGKLRRLARIRDGQNDLTYEQVVAMFEQQAGLCLACGVPMVWEPDDRYDPMRASIDHVLPIAKGGHNTISNVQLLHLGCNQAKHTRHIDYRK